MFELDPKEEASAEFVAFIGRTLQDAVAQRKIDENLTQQKLAERLEADRSRVNRCLSGHNNLTLKTLGELIWALKGRADFRIILDDLRDRSCNFAISAKQDSFVTAGETAGRIRFDPNFAPKVKTNNANIRHELHAS